MSYKQITKEERVEISTLLKTHHSISSIARILRRSKSTISRELIRNSDPNVEFGYYYTSANKMLIRVVYCEG